MYVVPKIELDQTLMEIKALALQIRNKKAILREETRVNKQCAKPVMPRTSAARARDRSVSRLRTEMEGLGVDMADTGDAHFTKTKRGRSTTPAAKRARLESSSRSKSRARSVSAPPRDEQGIKDVAVSRLTNFLLVVVFGCFIESPCFQYERLLLTNSTVSIELFTYSKFYNIVNRKFYLPWAVFEHYDFSFVRRIDRAFV